MFDPWLFLQLLEPLGHNFEPHVAEAAVELLDALGSDTVAGG